MKRFNRFILDEAAKPKLNFNRGHAYEFVLAAAMVARFTDRTGEGLPETLNANSVHEVMTQYFKGYPIWEVEEGDGIDEVEFDGAGLPAPVLAGLMVDEIRLKHKDVQSMVTKAISAVGGNTTLKDLSTEVITNGVEDKVIVRCGGTTGQMHTKSDIDLYINRKVVNGDAMKGIDDVDLKRAIGYSVKWGGVGQVTQWAGVDLAKNISDGFDSFGMTLSGAMVKPVTDAMNRSDYTGTGYTSRKDKRIVNDKKIVFNAVGPVFTKIASSFGESWFKGAANVKKLTTGILRAAKGKEEDIELVKNGFSYDRANFAALAKGLTINAKDRKVNVHWNVITTGNPKFQLWVGETQIFQIRCRYDADPIDKKKTKYKARFRIYVELGKGAIKFLEAYK